MTFMGSNQQLVANFTAEKKKTIKSAENDFAENKPTLKRVHVPVLLIFIWVFVYKSAYLNQYTITEQSSA